MKRSYTVLPLHHLLKTGSLGNEKRIVAVGFADEAPDKRPRKLFEEIVEYR
ncbi:hypothetical protein [Agathobacter rectalis]|uniref:hypothetical protein n=1 Tax=Agathobacter rectalis TaxID=39491 RepID=UPI0027D302B7|nr:hypothetical protein [Agathobacter rectalis]